MLTSDDLDRAQRVVNADMPPTPQYRWPLIEQAVGAEVWVKHENHTPTGAFKIRGGLVYMAELRATRPAVSGVVSATRGNHGQSLARAGAAHGVGVTICVPYGNSPEKNAAMRALGARLIEDGADFDAARARATALATAEDLHLAPSYHPWLVRGVATYAAELFDAAGALDAVYVPIGMGSGISGLIAVRDLLGLATEIVGVVAEGAPAYKLSFEAGAVVPSAAAHTFADGMACRAPDPEALAYIRGGAARVLALDDDAIADAIRLLYRATHNLAEGAGAAALAGLMHERARLAGKRAGVVLCGGNIDAPVMAEVLAGRTPAAF
ncbi:MAG: threonine dehydratase [Alphaproteobacteria bacterium]|jgi:threonine dehydratase|nr:threonine dehydratase [Alphaproteobacteria bacterium]